jgi:hypothetical protein
MVCFLLHHLLIFIAPNEITLPVRCVRPRIWILLIILILLEQHHTFLPTGHHDLFVVGAFRRTLLTVSPHLDVLLWQPIRGNGSLRRILNG